MANPIIPRTLSILICSGLLFGQVSSARVFDITKIPPYRTEQEEYESRITELISLAVSALIRRYGDRGFTVNSYELLVSDSPWELLVSGEPVIQGALLTITSPDLGKGSSFRVVIDLEGFIKEDTFLPVYYSDLYGISKERNPSFDFDLDFLIALYCSFHYPYLDTDTEVSGARKINYMGTVHQYYRPSELNLSSMIPEEERIYTLQEIASWLEDRYCNKRKKNPFTSDYDQYVFDWLFSEETIERLNRHHGISGDKVLSGIEWDFQKLIRKYM